MGWGKLKKAIGGVVRQLPGGDSKVGSVLYGGAVGGLTGSGLISSSVEASKRQEKANINQELATAQASANAAEQARLKAVAEESVRQQEDQARRRTIFGGGSIDEQNQRKTLLGL